MFGGDRELIDWLQRFTGYLLTGSTQEQIFLFCFGHSANGKSVFIGIFKQIMGDYRRANASETLSESKRQARGTTPDLAALIGVKLVLCSETEDNTALAESLVKILVSGDSMAVRQLYSAPVPFTPNFKLVMAVNDKPLVRDDDNGIWRRVRLVPFNRTFTPAELNPQLLDELKTESSHILAWMFVGCSQWQHRGLADTPAVIRDATDAYQVDQDVTGAWLIYHLSTSMCPQHRRDVLDTIRENFKDSISTLCISTRLIEAGVDVDLGAAIRYFAGLDSIAQAAGRCNRNGRRTVGRVHVINPIDDGIDRLSDIAAGRDVALRIFDEYAQDPLVFDHDVLGPKAMARNFDYYFFQRAAEMAYPVAAAVPGRDDTLLNMLPTNEMAVDAYKTRQQSAPPLHLRQAFMTVARAYAAIDAATQGVIVPYIGAGDDGDGSKLIAELCAAFEPEKQFALLRRAQQFSVNVFSHVFHALKRADAIGDIGEGIGIFHLRPEYYSDFFGLSDIPTTSMETHCV